MSVFQPVYRSTVYAPRSTSNPDETTVLAPAAGAPHSDDFKISTMSGVSGFQPYMGMPKGRKSRLDPVSKKLDIGMVSFSMLDKKTAGGNLERWISAFIGDALGKNRLLGLKVYIEESLDNGTTWSPYYVGRVSDFALKGLVQFTMRVKEANDLQKKVKLFEGIPTGSLLGEENYQTGYANKRLLQPLGPDWKYGPYEAIGPAIGTWKAARNSLNAIIEVDYNRTLNFDRGRIWALKPLLENVPEYDSDNADKKETNYGYGPIIEVLSLGGTRRRFYVTYLQIAFTQFATTGKPWMVQKMLLEGLPSNLYRAGAFFAVDSTCVFKILDPREVSEESPLLIGDVHPVQLWKDCLKGSFSLLDDDGLAVYRDSFPIDEDAFDTLIADKASYKTARYRIKESQDLSKFVQDNILQPYSLGYRMEATASAGVGINNIVPFSMSLPTTTVGIPTITQDDLVAGVAPMWVPGDPFVTFETNYYQDRQIQFDNVTLDEQNVSLMEENPIFLRNVELDNVYAGEGKYKVDATGMRYANNELTSDLTRQPFIVSRRKFIGEYAQTLHDTNVYRWARGPANVIIKAKRSGSIESTQVGDWRLLDIDFLPGEFNHARGEARLSQCMERSEEGINITLRFVDSGRNIQTAAPTVGNFNQVVGTNSVSGTVTIPDWRRLEGSFAATELTVATRPDATSSQWETVYRRTLSGGAREITLGTCPNGARIWPRFRTWTNSPDELELPSDWAFAANDYVDIAASSNVTGLSISEVSNTSARATWTVGDLTSSIQILKKADSSGSFDVVVKLKPGTNTFQVLGLDNVANNNPWTIGVRHVDSFGGTTPIVSSSFTCTAAALEAWPAIGGIYVVADDSRTVY